MINAEKQRKIAEWKLWRIYAEADSPNSYTREEIMEMIAPNKDELRKRLLKEYFDTFGENYGGDVIEDVVLDIKSLRALEKLAS